MIQLVSQVAPSSADRACAQRIESGVMSDQVNLQVTGMPLCVSGPRNTPTPSSNRPVTGGSIRARRLSIQNSDQVSASVSYSRIVMPWKPLDGNSPSSMFPAPPRIGQQRIADSKVSHS
jgi:hypothetical protein